jgi:hypothetical protein
VSKKQIKIIFISVILLLALKATSARAADYFVDSIVGNDSWDGLSQTYSAPNHGPWKTSNGPNWSGNFVGDDRILFKRGGIYSRLLVTTRHQSSDGHPITFGAYGDGEKPIITVASNIVTNWTDLGDGRYSSQLSTSTVEVVLEDWHDLKQTGSPDLSDGDWHIDTTNKILYYRPTSGIPADHEIRFGNAASLGFWQKADNFVVQDLHFIGAGIYHSPHGPDPFGNITIQRCDFNSNATIWVSATYKIAPYNGVPATNFVVEDCVFKNNRQNIYFVTDGKATWEGVVVRRNKFIDTDIAWDGHRYSGLKSDGSGGDIDGISVQDIKNSIFEYNEIAGGCYSGGIVVWFSNGFPGTGNIIRYNYIHDIDPDAINYGGEDYGTCNVKIYGNVIENVGNMPAFWGTYWGGLRLNRGQTPSNPSLIFNNTIINADASIHLYSRSDYYILKNNISINPKTGQHLRITDVQNNISDYNLYFGGNPDYFNRAYSQNRTLDEWRSYTGQDLHSFISDPKLANESGKYNNPSDFHLQSTSPAIDSGADVGLAKDYEGTPVPQGAATDIGAFEYKAAAPVYSNADINQDTKIDSSDLGILKSDFLKLTANLSNSRSDINGDGQCTARDLGILMSEWK